jgi:hypothetical protein
MRQDLIVFLFSKLEYLQQYDKAKVYYDNGQQDIRRVIHDAINYVLASDAPTYKDGGSTSYHLAQAADLICGFELLALKFENHEDTATDRLFFSSAGYFKKNYLKKTRRMMLA